MANLIASKSMTYATRRLKAGDEFEVGNRQHARVLVAIGKARPGGDADAGSETDIAALRQEYATLAGKKPYHGWDAETLTAKIAELGEK